MFCIRLWLLTGHISDFVSSRVRSYRRQSCQVWRSVRRVRSGLSPWCLAPGPRGWLWAHTSHLHTGTKQHVRSVCDVFVNQVRHYNCKPEKCYNENCGRILSMYQYNEGCIVNIRQIIYKQRYYYRSHFLPEKNLKLKVNLIRQMKQDFKELPATAPAWVSRCCESQIDWQVIKLTACPSV